MSTGIICGNEACGMELDPDPPSGRRPCPACGSMARTQTVAPPPPVPVLEETGQVGPPPLGADDEMREITEPIRDNDGKASRSSRAPRAKSSGRGSAKKKPAAKKRPAAKKKPAAKKPAKKKSPAKKSPKKKRK